METSTILIITFCTAMAAMVLLWLVSLAIRNASIVDAFWGSGFALIAIVSFALGSG